MRIQRVLLAVPLFDRLLDHSSVSIDVCKAGASATARLAQLGPRVCAVVPLMLLLTAFDSAALAQSGSAAQPAISQTAHSFAGFINEASQRFAIAPNWIRSVQSIESAGDVHARSPKGAVGLMQIMPATWAELRSRERPLRSARQHSGRHGVLARTARSVRLAWRVCRVQRGTLSL